MEYANIIQGFSRTNRLFGKEKPFWYNPLLSISQYDGTHIEEAKVYSGDKNLGLFVDKLGRNLTKLNNYDISVVFSNEGIDNFEQLPDDDAAKGKFANLFRTFNDYLEAAQIQGFTWEKTKYDCDMEEDEAKQIIMLNAMNKLTKFFFFGIKSY
ncbi:type I restriction endonuclease subunit R, EcoR124 family [Peribacillus frigoritolerans]|uniref:type I restriction endonuclease subunit R, EcoR124 family n=1 Tax=Peribacillus frigoritolerans TaxID=450367 RepID=UPI002E9A5322|nr:hypothetical protein [Peribacillus frigoritolerans]